MPRQYVSQLHAPYRKGLLLFLNLCEPSFKALLEVTPGQPHHLQQARHSGHPARPRRLQGGRQGGCAVPGRGHQRAAVLPGQPPAVRLGQQALHPQRAAAGQGGGGGGAVQAGAHRGRGGLQDPDHARRHQPVLLLPRAARLLGQERARVRRQPGQGDNTADITGNCLPSDAEYIM